MHAAGVAHGDLKRKDNIIVGRGRAAVSHRLRDRRAAQRVERGSAAACSSTTRRCDYNAWIKLKYGRRIDPAEVAALLSPEDAALYRPLWTERIARAVRVPWQKITLRRPRQRWRAARRKRDDA